MESTQTLLEMFRNLDGRNQEELLTLLQYEVESKSQVLENVRQELREVNSQPVCIHCGHEKVYKRGFYKGIQQLSCAKCKRWFSEISGTPLKGIHKRDNWQEYIRLMQEGGTIKGIAKQMGISIETSFRWRHKILAALAEKEVQKLGEIVECDEMEFVMNNKGEVLDRPARKCASDANKPSHMETTRRVQVIVAVDREGHKVARVIEAERINSKHVQKSIGKKLNKGCTLITDKHSAYVKYTKDLKTINHKTIKASEQKKSTDKVTNIQRVNQTHKEIRDFMKKFCGGVGTKYLQNYLNWYLNQKTFKMSDKKLRLWAQTILTSAEAMVFYKAVMQNVVNIRT